MPKIVYRNTIFSGENEARSLRAARSLANWARAKGISAKLCPPAVSRAGFRFWEVRLQFPENQDMLVDDLIKRAGDVN